MIIRFEVYPMEYPISIPPQTLSATQRQLRQDFLYMHVNDLSPQHLTLDAVNRCYQFSFPAGCFCIFILGAVSKIRGESVPQDRMLAADKYVQEFLRTIPGDFETLIQGPKLYGLVGSTLSQEALSDQMHSLFNGIRNLRSTYTCAWTMGLGRYVFDLENIRQSLFSAQHALKYSIRDGLENFYDGNSSCVIYEGGLVIMTPSEQIALKQLIQKPDHTTIEQGILTIFRCKQEQIQKYPVFAYMLSLQILGITIQTLRELMPVDRKTYELSQTNKNAIDDFITLDALVDHTVSSVQALCQRYQLFLGSGKSQPIWLVITYIQEHYTEHITLHELSRISDRNPQYISAVFSKTCGMTINAYIASLRVEAAKQLLRTSSLSISKIAAQIGYQDTKYFSRIFRKATGISPTEFRNADLEI